MTVETCLLKHLGAKSPINAYRADMAADVQELVADGMTSEAAWIQVVDAKLTDLKAERTRIEQVVADAYAKTAAGKPAATDDVPAPSAAPQEAADEDMRGYAWALVKDGKVVRSGSLPSPEFSPASDDTKLSYYKAMADKTGADLHIGGYPGAAAWAPQEGLIFGMTWDELSARQQNGGRAVSAPEGKMPKDAVLAYSPAVPAAVATHKDPGEPAEVVTPAVVADAIKTAAANTDRTRGEMKAEALRLIDAAIAKAPSTSEIDGNIIIRDPITDRGRKVINAVRKFGGDDDTIQVKATSGSDGKWEVVDDSYDGSGTGRKRNTRLGGLVGTPAIARSQLMDLMRQLQPDGTLSEIDTVTIKVPGDGTFTVKNTVERLKEFRKQVEASPGFKDRQVRPAVEDAGDGAQRGSGGQKSAIQNMIDDGDAQAAVDFAAARGVNIREVLSGDKVRLPKIAGLTPTTDEGPVAEFEPEAARPEPQAEPQAAAPAPQEPAEAPPAEGIASQTFDKWARAEFAANEYKASYLEAFGGNENRATLGSIVSTIDNDRTTAELLKAAKQKYASELLNLPRETRIGMEVFDALTPEMQREAQRHFYDLDSRITRRTQDEYAAKAKAEGAKKAPYEAALAEVSAEIKRLDAISGPETQKQRDLSARRERLREAIYQIGQGIEPDGRLLKSATAPKAAQETPAEAGPAKAAKPGIISDVGEKIGGARKDTAVSTGTSRKRTSDDDRPAWARRFQVSQSITGIDENGEHTGPWVIRDLKNTDFMGQPKQVGRSTYATKEEAEAQVPLAAVALKHRVVLARSAAPKTEADVDATLKADMAAKAADDERPGKIEYGLMQTARKRLAAGSMTQANFNILQEKYGAAAAQYTPPAEPAVKAPTGEKYEIWRDITDRKRVKVVDQQFDSREEAMAYMMANAVQIVEANTTFGEADLPLPPDRARTGPERRTGNVTADDFKATFGFRGVQFGNWNNQDERQALMNDAWDGLMDLADVLGLPPKALGLNGDLALAFGARGHGLNSARAHYEPARTVINLTKEQGAGSLAHEWFHALDHYFGRQDGKASATWKVGQDGTRTLDVSGDGAEMVSSGFRGERSGVRKGLRNAYDAMLRTMTKKAETYVEDTAKADKWTGVAREELAQALASLRRELAEQKDVRYYKRNNKPASAELLAEFDAIAKQMLDGEVSVLATDWKTFVKGGDKPANARGASIATRWTNDSLERLSAIHKEVRGRSGFDGTNKQGVLDRLRGNMERYSQRLKMLAEAQSGTEKVKMVPTEFAMNAKELDQGRGTDYWTTPHEMAARAFQGYVEDKIAERGGVSRFLNYAPANAAILTPWGFKRPYPAGDERKAINNAFDEFVGELKTRTDDAGNVEMFSLADEAGSDIAAAWKTLAENDDLFAFPKSDAADLAEIASEAAPNLSVEPATGRLPDDVQAAWHVYPPNKPKTQDNRGYVIHYKDGKVEVNVAKFQQGDAGSQVYAVAGNYAFNNGLEFAGDRLGITDVAVQRRLENMISLALKFGTTDFMIPHPDMLKTLGLKWTQGDSNANLQNMLLASYENAISKYPALKDVVYDPSTGKLQSQSRGVALTDAEAARLVAGARVRGLPIGRRTLSRLSVTQAVAESQAGPERGQLLALIGERARGPVESLGVLSGVAYSPSDGVANDYVPADTAAYEPAGNADTEAVERLAASLNAGQPRSRHVVLDAVAPRAGGTGARARELAAVATTAKRLFGRRIVFVRFQGAPLFNGVVSTKHPGVIFLNADSKKPMMAVLGHELLHELRKSMPGVYKELQARLDAMMRDQPSYFARIEQAYTAAGRAVPKDWMEELHADVVGDFFTDAQFWQDMAAEQPGLFKRVAGAILKFLDNVAEQLAGVRTFGTDRYLRDVAAARAAVADAMRQFSGTEVGAMAGQAEGISLSMDGGQTEAAAFKRWFGESKVVDAAGKPLVVYHGTTGDFSEFNPDMRGASTRVSDAKKGFFFVANGKAASEYTWKSGGMTGSVMPVYLSMIDPLVVDMPGEWAPGKYDEALDRAKSAGYDGVVIRGATTLGAPGDVYIAFRPEQIKSAIGNRGTFDGTDPDIRLSIAGSVAESNGDYASQVRTAQDLIDARGSGVFDFNRMGATKQDRIRTVVDGSRPFWLGALTRDQIADIYGKEIQPVKEYDALTRAMENERSKMAGDADTLYGEWAKIDQKDNDRLARIMLDATVHQVHPDGPFVPGGENDTERKRVHGMISTQFRLLPPEAKAMYGKVKGFHLDTLTKLRDALMARIERQVDGGQARAAALTNIRQMFDKYLGSGPYFPLSRFGDYLVVATREEDGERVVASYETAGEQQAAARKLESDGFLVKMKTAKTYSRETDGAAGKFIGDVLTLVDGLDMDDASVGGRAADLKKKLLDDINQLFIKALPDLSYRKHFMHRKGTAGFSSDVMRGFASSAFHAASHIARLNHGDKMTFALQDAFSAIENAPAGDFNQHSQVLNELTKRHDAALNPNTHPIAAMLNQVGFVMYLGLSPAAGIVNMLQTVMVTMPHLGARYGFTKANTSLAAAYKDILAAPMNAKNGWNAAQSNKLTAAERAVMTELQDEGVIDLTQAHDLASATGLDTGNVTRSKAAFAMSRAMKIVGWTFHIPEVMNRQVTALSAYRLEMEKSGNVEAAKDAAREAIKRTHFDYSGSNRARFMQSNLARVMLQFKQYSQNMTYLLGRAAFQALKGESPEVRAIARKQLVATLGVTFGMAGALGLPGIGGVMGLIGAFVQGLDDDDKPWDWKVEFRNLLADTVGQEAGEVIAHGIPRAIPRALMPWDISSRVGMGDMWFRSNDREGQNPREAWANDMQNILGPSAGTLLGMYTAADHMARGNWSKGVESMVPKFLRDLLKAMREGNEGMTNYNGEPLLDVGGLEVMGRAIGFAPARGSEMFEARNAVKNAETAINMKRQRLLSTMVKARLDLDSAAIMEIQADIMDFNRRNPAFRITSESIVKSTQAKRRNMAATKAGIRLPKGKDELRELGRFAEVE